MKYRFDSCPSMFAMLCRAVLLMCAFMLSLSAYAASLIGASASNRTLKIGDSLPINLTFDAPVTVTGSPKLLLNANGAGTAVATCAAVVSSVTVVCTYTVAAGDSTVHLDATSVSLNGGTIKDILAANATLTTLPIAGAAGSLFTNNTVVVDGVVPTLLSTAAVDNIARPNTLTLTFSEAMGGPLLSPSSYVVTNKAATVTYSVASVNSPSATSVVLTLAAVDPNNPATYFTTADVTAKLSVTPSAALLDAAGNSISNTPVSLTSTGSNLDAVSPTIVGTGISADSSVQPNTVTLTFSELLVNNANVTNVAKYAVTNSSGGIVYSLATAAQNSSGVVTLTLATPLPTSTATYITNTDINSLKVTLAAGFADVAGNALAPATIAQSGAGSTKDTTAPTLVSALAYVDSTHVKVTFSEKVNKANAETISNYSLSGTGALAVLSGAPSAASLAVNGVDVTLTVPSLSRMKLVDSFSVTAGVGITDLAGVKLAAPATATLTGSSAIPALVFTPTTNVSAKSPVISNAITISGLNVPFAISVVPGSDSSLLCSIAPVATGIFSSFGSCAPTTPLTLYNGDQLQVQLTSSALGNTTVTGGVSIGGTSASFSVTTAPALAVAGVVYSPLATLTSALSSVDPAITLSANGVVQVPSSVTAGLSILPSAPVNTALLLKSGGSYNFTLGSVSQVIQPVGGDVLVVTKSYSVDGDAAINLLELASGRALLTYSGSNLPIASISLGAGASAGQILISSAGSGALSLDMQHVLDGTAVLGVVAGGATLRLPSKASTVATTDLPTRIYSSEVVSLSAAGKVVSIRLGSVAGTTQGVVGDALPASNLPAGVKSRVKLPYLGAASERADPNKPLMQSLFDFTGSRSTLTKPAQGGYGEIPLAWDGVVLNIMPIGDVLVDPTRTDGITLASDGHFEVSRNGVYVKLTTTVCNLDLFLYAVQSTYSSGTVTLSEDGAFEINNSGKTLLMKPNLISDISGVSGIGITSNANNQLVFQTLNQSQVMFPHVYNMTQLAGVLASLDPAVTLRDNLDGSVTATIKGAAYVLLPKYEVLSPIGGVPPEHRADPWWVSSDGAIYFKYTSGAAQGVTVQ